MADSKTTATFIEPMLLLSTGALPEGAEWSYELKLDGYRALAFKAGGKVHLRSRNDKDFATRYAAIAAALEPLPDETVIDGEVVAMDTAGRPSFNALQKSGAGVPVFYYAFDVLTLAGRDVMRDPLEARRELLRKHILPKLDEPIRYSPHFTVGLADLIRSVRAQGLEGVVAKRLDSRYEPGQRSGVWRKMRINQGQDFVIGGYTLGGRTFDALVFGYFEGDKLLYAGRTRNGFTPAVRDELFRLFRGLEVGACPFANLPEAPGRPLGSWSDGGEDEGLPVAEASAGGAVRVR